MDSDIVEQKQSEDFGNLVVSNENEDENVNNNLSLIPVESLNKFLDIVFLTIIIDFY